MRKPQRLVRAAIDAWGYGQTANWSSWKARQDTAWDGETDWEGGRRKDCVRGVGRNPFEEGMVFLLPTGEAFGLRNRLPHGCFSESEGGGEMLPFLGGGGFGVGPLAVSTVFSMGERMGE